MQTTVQEPHTARAIEVPAVAHVDEELAAILMRQGEHTCRLHGTRMQEAWTYSSSAVLAVWSSTRCTWESKVLSEPGPWAGDVT